MGSFRPQSPPDPPASVGAEWVTAPTQRGVGEAAASTPSELVRPRWRGRLHLAAFAVSVPVGVALCVVAGSSSARIAAAVYSLTLSGVFGVSAAFHLVAWSPAGHRRMSRLDRAMIYLQLC
jgi:predicted membrane channel-forming protein YqfA (hemolysin III family)